MVYQAHLIMPIYTGVSAIFALRACQCLSKTPRQSKQPLGLFFPLLRVLVHTLTTAKSLHFFDQLFKYCSACAGVLSEPCWLHVRRSPMPAAVHRAPCIMLLAPQPARDRTVSSTSTQVTELSVPLRLCAGVCLCTGEIFPFGFICFPLGWGEREDR